MELRTEQDIKEIILLELITSNDGTLSDKNKRNVQIYLDSMLILPIITKIYNYLESIKTSVNIAKIIYIILLYKYNESIEDEFPMLDKEEVNNLIKVLNNTYPL